MNFPVDFLSRTEALLNSEINSFLEALQTEAPVSIRVNPSKVKTTLPLEPVKWCENGFYLPRRPSFTFDPLFHAGCYYPQEASSMFVGHAIKPYLENDIRVLDLCAAPGGKSTHILSLLTADSLLVSNEVIRSRANILAENVSKSGYSNIVVTNNDPSDIGKLKSYFDIVLVDAPCSGEGMFRKDAGAVNEWSPANVNLCHDRQQRILADVWDALKPEGIMLYSTCTYNAEEDENNVAWICSELGAEAIRIDIPSDWNVSGAINGEIPVCRFFPHKTKGEGFFLAVLKKNANDDASQQTNKQRKDKKGNGKPQKMPDTYRSYLNDSQNFDFIASGDYWNAFPLPLTNDYNLLKDKLKIVHYGITLGETKGKSFIPDHSLAMSNALNRDAFTCHEVDYQTAIAYLRKEALTLDASLPKTYILLTYKNIALGFVKNIGNRANNLYPQEWRIRSANIPDEVSGVL